MKTPPLANKENGAKYDGVGKKGLSFRSPKTFLLCHFEVDSHTSIWENGISKTHFTMAYDARLSQKGSQDDPLGGSHGKAPIDKPTRGLRRASKTGWRLSAQQVDVVDVEDLFVLVACLVFLRLQR